MPASDAVVQSAMAATSTTSASAAAPAASAAVGGSRAAVADAITELARWAVQTPRSAIPPAALARAARILADDLGAMMGARDEPEVAALRARLVRPGSAEESTVFAPGAPRTDRRVAALLNAVACNTLELDEGYRVTPCHAGLYVLPALLAEAEARQLTVGELLHRLVLAYEIVTRVARAWDVDVVIMQSHGRYAAVGAAAATGLAAGLDLPTFVAALGCAATLITPSPRNHLSLGIMARNAWPAAGATNGMMAVEWAQCGIGGEAGGFHDVYTTILGGRARPERLVEDLGRSWAVLDGYTKVHACCQHLHSAVEACLDARRALLADGGEGGDKDDGDDGALAEQIAAVDVETHGLAMPLANGTPTTTLGAKFSMPHAVAAAFVMGTGGAQAFDARSLSDRRIAALRPAVSLRDYQPVPTPPNDRPARVTVHLRDGRRLVTECLSARGGPDRPLADDVVLDKLDALASPLCPPIVACFTDLIRSAARSDDALLAEPWAAVARRLFTAGRST